MPAKPQKILDRVEQAVGESRFLRPMHLGLDDIDRARAAVDETPLALEIPKPDQAGDDGVQYAFGRLAAVGQADRGIGHQMTDIADQHQAAAWHGDRSTIGRGIAAIR